jgi:VanZ family protein
MGPVTAALRPQSDRGDMLAAGAVLLTTAIVMIDIRMSEQWSDGAQLIVTLAAFVPIFASALLATPDEDRPHAYQSVLIVAGLTLLVPVLVYLAEVLGSDQPLSATGAIMWMAALFALIAAYPALRLGSAIAALLGVVAAGLAVQAFVDEVFDPKTPATFRWITLLLIVAYAGGAGALSEVRRRQSVQFVNAAAVWTIILALTFLGTVIASVFTGLGGGESIEGAGWGWEVVLFAASLAVIAYATLAGEPGPAYLGFIALLTTAVLVGLPEKLGEGSIVGWPLVLLLAGAAGVVFALRPNGGPPATRVMPTTEPPPAATAPPPEGAPPPPP